jgi:hypothetical protein
MCCKVSGFKANSGLEAPKQGSARAVWAGELGALWGKWVGALNGEPVPEIPAASDKLDEVAECDSTGATPRPKFKRGAESILTISLSLQTGHVTSPCERCVS